MKYVKFRMVDCQTGISVFRQEPENGPAFPRLGDMYDLFTDFVSDWYYAKVGDTTVFDEENYICEITENDYIDGLEKVVDAEREDYLNQAYQQEKELRSEIFGKYHESATIAGIQKFQEALEFLDTGVISTNLQTESNVRSISVEDLANKIIENHNKFREIDSKISGLRGMMVDRINSFTFDRINPYTSFMEWKDTEFIPNIRTIRELSSIDESTPGSKLGKYVPDLSRRWDYMMFLENQKSEEV